ncbi:LacI family DNA-binding transcriptional regulator [Aureimonas leprariae]|uniref:LacI family DNA-binding transcriptional regulator n=1 Tax=Plantimonas leprariae TaxID=2615207 RepID=UPI001AEF1A5C|nr:LacI family DNA-binding transcriptional regulator [Aureimonas leprariae]
MSTSLRSERVSRIKDVALRAGVSTATVSRALAEPGSVRPALRERVLEAVRALGYTPNAAARSLRAGHTRTILVLTRARWSAPFFSAVLNGIDATLAEAGYSMILGNFDTGDRRRTAILDMMFSGHIDGAIVLSGIAVSDGTRSMLEAGLPIVSICAAVEGTQAVVTDEAECIARLAAHLAGTGHRDFLYVTGPAANYNETIRRAALEASLGSWEGSRLRLAAGDFTMPSGAEAASAFLAMRPRPTAVVCCSDEMAIGFIKAVQAAGLDVPRDVSVAGFDGIEFADFCSPTLTTIRQPRFELGAAGAKQLLAALRDGSAPAEPVVLQSELRVGASTAAPPLPGSRQPSVSAR